MKTLGRRPCELQDMAEFEKSWIVLNYYKDKADVDKKMTLVMKVLASLLTGQKMELDDSMDSVFRPDLDLYIEMDSEGISVDEASELVETEQFSKDDFEEYKLYCEKGFDMYIESLNDRYSEES